MSFVPVSGPATFRAGEQPRDGTVEFTGGRRTVSLPIRGALPVLTRAHAQSDVHPSVALLSGAALLGMRLVAAGRFGPDETGTRWQVAGLDATDEDRIAQLARARAREGLDEGTAEGIVRAVLDAVADAMPRAAPLATRRSPARDAATAAAPRRVDPDFTRRLEERVARARARGSDDRPQLVNLALRVEADEEELVAGAVRLVLQVVAADNAAHVADAALLWTEGDEPGSSHGFGDRARTHASIALRAAAEAWPVLDRLLALRVPDQITLDSDELLSLLDEGALALDAVGVQVLWPRYLDRDVTSRVVLSGPSAGRDEPLQTGLFGPDALFGFSWQLALHGDALSDEEMDALATAATPVIRIRDHWTVVDSAVLKRARKRLIKRVAPAAALAATLTEVVQVEDVEHQAVVGASLLRVRDQLLTAAVRDPIEVPAGLAATLRDYQRHGFTWLAELTGLGLGACLADDMGLGKTVQVIALHLHRHEAGFDTLAPLAAQPTQRRGPTLVVCPASLLGNWEAEIRRFAPGVPVRRLHGAGRTLEGLGADEVLGDPGFVLTTYGTMRNDAEQLAGVAWGLVVADEAQHVKNARSSTARALRTIPSAARVALTGTPVENDLTELWAILDWAVPGLLGSRNAFRKVWAAPIESGLEPTKARQFADLIGPFLLRRRKSDPGIAPELPAKTETDHLIGLTREQVVLYETYVRDCMRRIEEADEDTRRGLVLTLLTGLKQICNHPAHFLKQSDPRPAGRSEKLDLLDELIGTVLAEGGAALVFTQYVAMARLLERHLARAGVPHQFLHGGTPVREREAMVARFQAGSADGTAGAEGGVPVFLLSLKAGGTGLNLTRADHVIHVDRWWNPAVEEQATDRAYRIGQTRPVQVHRFITQGTIEEKIAELLSRKRALADTVLGRGEAGLTELSNDELRDLVELRGTRP
ncbi:DEAD/DEAH box helicase [Nocardioides sp. Soil805]|uniref:DEAD/DEAH box helicase n=1 Tax=Nocardioides sp. Soil805 TaxID=1736416 RepID=UPI000702BC4A|nr:DEAD/DEAH box helicase [Nocardioides sp. Soil805]KRF37532.1 helicase [Nocardioides sp. Soil805]